MPKQPDLDPWERQPNESDVAFAAFLIYRDLAPRRRLALVAQQSGKSVPLMERWSAHHKWRDRAAAWDREQDRVGREAQLEEVRLMHRRHANLAVRMLNKAAQRLEGDPANNVAALNVSKLTAEQVARLAEVGVKIERSARGEPEKVEVAVTADAETKTALDALMETLNEMGDKLRAPTFNPIPTAGPEEDEEGDA